MTAGDIKKIESDEEEGPNLTKLQTSKTPLTVEQMELLKGEEKEEWKVTDEELQLIKNLMKEFPELDYGMASLAFKWCQLFPEEVEQLKAGTLDLSEDVIRPEPGTLKSVEIPEGELKPAGDNWDKLYELSESNPDHNK